MDNIDPSNTKETTSDALPVPEISGTLPATSDTQNKTSQVTNTLSQASNRKSEVITIASIIFIICALSYIGYTLVKNSQSNVATETMGNIDSLLSGKALLKTISNKEIIKDVKSLAVLSGEEGLLKDTKAVYRCNTELYQKTCTVQDEVKHPERFVRVTNIFGKDSQLVYVVDEKTNNYKVLQGASAASFRPLYNSMTESLMGLYAGDDSTLFKGEKVLTIKSVPTGMNDALFYKLYKQGEKDPPERHPYSRMAKGFDGDIQYMADDQFIYHGDGKASSTDPYIHLTKVEGADRATFTYYQQKMTGTSYLKYAYDKNNVYCDNVSLGTDGYFTSDGLTIIKDPNPKSLEVIYPSREITEKNAALQVAKTETQVFVNCTPQKNIDAKTFSSTSDGKLGSFSDKNVSFYLTTFNQSEVSSSSLAVITGDPDGNSRISPYANKDLGFTILDQYLKKIGDTNIYLYQDKVSTKPILLFKDEVTTGKKTTSYLNRDEVGKLSITEITEKEFFAKFKEIQAIVTLTIEKGLKINVNNKVYLFSKKELSSKEVSRFNLEPLLWEEEGYHDAGLKLIDSFEIKGNQYFLIVGSYSGHSNSMCGASSYKQIHLLSSGVDGNKIYPGYKYFDGCSQFQETYSDGSVGIWAYKDKNYMLFSNQSSIALFDYSQPERGFLIRQN